MRLAFSIAAGIFLGVLALAGFVAIFAPKPEPIVFDTSGFVPHTASVARPVQPVVYLTADEACVGGTVVQRSFVGSTPSYVQLVDRGRPVRCVGNRRL